MQVSSGKSGWCSTSKGYDYRLVVKNNYAYRVTYIRFVGTHAEYDKIDVEEV